VFLHIWALHVVGNGNPAGISVKSEQDTVPFHPQVTMKDAFALALFCLFFGWFVFYMPNFLGHPDNYIEANPLVTPAHIVPEWYYLPFYAILRAIPDKLGGVLAMFAAILVLFVLPWLDTSKVRSGAYRSVWFKMAFWLFVVNAVLLGWLGAKPAEGVYVISARIATAYYFGYFIVILPILGFIEKPKALPASIAEAVLAKHGGTAHPEGAASAPDRQA
jgi:ubiquinol-cytochrome c reductase cytochrome b subunit